MRKLTTVVASVAISLGFFSSCSNDPTVTGKNAPSSATVTFTQIDREGRPGLKELYLPYASHDAFNRAAPSGDIAASGPAIVSFVTGTGGRSAAIGAYVSTLLTPDVLIADVANPATRASYLGFETSGQFQVDCQGNAPTTFGGRAPLDDVVSAMLGLTFGTLATSTTLKAPTPNVGAPIPPDDGAERDGRAGRPNLANQMVPCTGKGVNMAAFPYLGSPL